jgi:hypothetical protein
VQNIEHKLLIACAGVQVNLERTEKIRILLREHIDWEYLIRTAFQHSVIPLLCRNLTNCFPKAIPRDVGNQLRSYFFANARRNLLLTAELLGVLDLFETQGILAIPFKGPILATIVYNDQSLRQYSDLDILIPERCVPTARDLVVSMGYRPDSAHQLDFEAHFFHPEGICNLDLHWDISYKNNYRKKDASFALDLQGVWERAKPVSFAGRSVLHFSPEDLLIIRCQDAVKEYWKDNWPQLKWICDIAEIVRVYPEMDWAHVMEQGMAFGNQRLLFLCLSLAKNLFGAPLPRDVLKCIQADPRAGDLASEVTELLFRNLNSANRFLDRKSGFLARNLFCIRLKERPRQRFPYYRRLIREYRLNASMAIRKKEDREFLLLPESLSYLYYLLAFLYYLIRPIWRVGRYGAKSLRLFLKFKGQRTKMHRANARGGA